MNDRKKLMMVMIIMMMMMIIINKSPVEHSFGLFCIPCSTQKEMMFAA